ncbi:SHOCT domain-containing protein [Alphaproteobacteria bacterium]|nr:SHOCT domain-containing protein [Alphaproteobacteria bacterium]
MKLLNAIVLLLMSFLVNPAHSSEWRKVSDKNRKVGISLPDLSHKSPRITIKVADSFGGRSEWVCWNKFRSREPNACVTYQITGGNGFGWFTAKDINKWAKVFKKISYSQKGELFSIKSRAGSVQVMKGNTNDEFNKDCITFSKSFNGNTEIIRGWHCSKTDHKLSKDTIDRIIKSINLNGSAFDYWETQSGSKPTLKIKSDSKISNDAITLSTKVEKLKEAKNLFKRDIITKGEYEQLRKKILGLD